MYRSDTSARDTVEAPGETRVDAISGQKGSEASMTSQRSGVLELAVLGLLHETPMHGYELRKRLNAVLGAFRAFGYGSLYPCLKELLQDLLSQAGPAAWEDDGFGVHFAFFGQTRADIRLRILEGRRSRLEERLEAFRAGLSRTRERVDSYTLELQRHGLESVEREVRWLNELIASERQTDAESASRPESHKESGAAGTSG